MHQEKLLCLVFLSFCAGYSSEFTTIGPKILQPTSTNQDLIVSSTSDKLDTDLVSISDVTTLSTTSETVLSTLAPSTLAPSTLAPSTLAPSTLAPSTLAPSTQAPSPPKPSVWVVVDKDTNVTCIVIKLVAIIIIPSNTTDGQPRNTSFNLPSNASSNGTCHRNSAEFADQQVLSLNWIDEFQHFNNLTFVFEKNITRSDGKEQFYLSDLYLNRNSGNVSYFFNKHLNGSIQAVEVNNSYRCNTEDTLKMDPNLENLTIFPSYLRLSHVQMEAFRTQSNDEFGLAMDCAADRIVTSDIVPIAVGCALAALVVIVLVAYLIGRRRARQRGYQSV